MRCMFWFFGKLLYRDEDDEKNYKRMRERWKREKREVDYKLKRRKREKEDLVINSREPNMDGISIEQ